LGVLFARRQGEGARTTAPDAAPGEALGTELGAELVAQTDRARALGAEGLLHAALRRSGAAAGQTQTETETETETETAAEVRERLRAAYAATAAKNLQLLAEADEVLRALAAAGVVAAPMKGVALFREGVVKDLGARPTTDLDVATRRVDRVRALKVLTELGFRPSATEVSFKHLTPMRRRDLAVELHEIAYWSGSTREVFGAEHLAVADRATRLGRLWALQVHHLVLGSPPDAALLVRTLADVAAFADIARGDASALRAAREALDAAGLLGEAIACDEVIAELRGEPLVLGGDREAREGEADGQAGGQAGGKAGERAELRAGLRRSLLAPLEAGFPADPREVALGHLIATARRQPVGILARTAAVLLFPPRQAVADGLGVDPRSPRVWVARVKRPVELGYRALGALPRALRGRSGRG
jgi:hypothetical protein